MIPIYEHFARPWEHCLDFSDDMLNEMYLHESRGEGTISPKNGYYQGKKWMNVTVAMWHEDAGITLFVHELYEEYPDWHWWLDRVLGRKAKWY